MIRLGDIVRDIVTGFTGIAVSHHDYLNGCHQFGVAGKVGKDGKVPATEHFDHQRLVFVKKGIEPTVSNTGGPQRDMPRQ